MGYGDKQWKNIRVEEKVYDRLVELKSGDFQKRWYGEPSFSTVVDLLVDEHFEVKDLREKVKEGAESRPSD